MSLPPKNREPLIRFKKIMDMVRAGEKEQESYKSRLFDLENVKEKNSSSRHFKRWNSDSALRIEDPDIDDGTVFRKTAALSIRPVLPLLLPVAKDEPPQPREVTDEEEDSGKRDICIYALKHFSYELSLGFLGYKLVR